MTGGDLIQRSFELAAERCADLTPPVYRRLFREYPEAEPMFRREASDLVKGSMLALTIDAIIDFAGDRTGGFRMIECEVQSHDADRQVAGPGPCCHHAQADAHEHGDALRRFTEPHPMSSLVRSPLSRREGHGRR